MGMNIIYIQVSWGKMKSWKREEGWTEQSQEWRSSGDLNMYSVIEREGLYRCRTLTRSRQHNN